MNRASSAGPPAKETAFSKAAASLSASAIYEVKHCLPSLVKHCLITLAVGQIDNKVMLDSVELARRIREAMDQAKPKKVTSAALAAACDVTPQAVNGWRTTGRVAKRHLETIADLTGRPLEYFLGSSSTPVPYSGIVEGEAIARLRKALPEWRRYVIGLAMEDSHEAQKLLLDSMRKAVFDPRVEQFIKPAPHAAARGIKNAVKTKQ